MVRITVIWLSVKYQNFFCFQNVTSPPNAINVPFISSHIKVVIRTVFTKMTVLLSMWAGFIFFLFCFVFLFFLPEAEFNSFFKGNSSCIEKLLY